MTRQIQLLGQVRQLPKAAAQNGVFIGCKLRGHCAVKLSGLIAEGLVGFEPLWCQAEGFKAAVIKVFVTLQKADFFQSANGAADLCFMRARTGTDVARGHVAIAAQMKQHPPFGAGHAVLGLIARLEPAACDLAGYIQQIGQEILEVEMRVILLGVRGFHRTFPLIVTFSTNTKAVVSNATIRSDVPEGVPMNKQSQSSLQVAQSPVGTTEGYMPGFGNDFETEALPGALPQGMNSPQKCNYGLYGEQLSGTAFTAPSHQNERTWCYRIRPSVKHSGRYRRIDVPYWKSAPHVIDDVTSLGQYRWDPLPHADKPLTWVTGMHTMTTAGDVNTQVGMASHVYLVTQSMKDAYFYSADSELLVVPQEGRLRFCTELGIIDLEPKEIAILPRGLVYRVEVIEGPARGFVCENYGQKFELPARGPIGANCMANRRDFKTPVAAFEDREVPSTLTMKWCGQFHETEIGQSPLDVVAWHGNYAPVKYDMRNYCPIGAILFDHPDPSIFTVLTAPSGVPGTANIDFVLFRERWMTMEDTFRPPWYHKNVMSELMGNIYGKYDAKPNGFAPGSISLHNMMIPHGPDKEAFERASNADLKPEKLDETMSFMFETRFPQHLTAFAAKEAPLQDDYIDCWASLEKKFDGTPGKK